MCVCLCSNRLTISHLFFEDFVPFSPFLLCLTCHLGKKTKHLKPTGVFNQLEKHNLPICSASLSVKKISSKSAVLLSVFTERAIMPAKLSFIYQFLAPKPGHKQKKGEITKQAEF